jgi:hypothetical protein
VMMGMDSSDLFGFNNNPIPYKETT